MARKILLADDSVTAQNMGRKILADAGYEVITVNNGSAALKRITEQKPDLIVLDVYMPGYSGLEVCQRLKEVGETARIPILLTVGKLEPFKPEEVKRVRADGFIVKPFEASELLSALSKLEDRIVPRAESSKPGRFARATAALDQPYDRTVAIEEETGWKNRIKFPSKKKSEEKDPQDETDEAAVYNPVNKDLRTVIEHKIAETPSHGKEDERVDLGALAPAGLPKDVTPEEIAALAAAAAQMQGKVAEGKSDESIPAVQSEVEVPKQPTREEATAPVEAKPEVTASETGDKAQEHTIEAVAVTEAPEEQGASALNAPPVEDSVDEPVTMAVSASAESEDAPRRWTAVSVALAPEDAAISLEQEMQKAYAAAAAESGYGASIATGAPADLPVTTASVSPAEPAVSEPVISVPATVVPDAAPSLAVTASPAADAVSAAAEPLEAVAASFVMPKDTPTDSPGSLLEPAITSLVEKESNQQPASVGLTSVSAEVEKAKQEIPQAETHDLHGEEQKEQVPAASVPPVEVHENLADVGSSPNAPAIESKQQVSEAAVSEAKVSEAAVSEAAVSEAVVGKEPDFAASTAAAWASWHRIRESGNDSAAKAVAAGAENNPSDVASDNDSDPGIASIVDSVLADLRPKIVEEISRKLGKKK